MAENPLPPFKVVRSLAGYLGPDPAGPERGDPAALASALARLHAAGKDDQAALVELRQIGGALRANLMVDERLTLPQAALRDELQTIADTFAAAAEAMGGAHVLTHVAASAENDPDRQSGRWRWGVFEAVALAQTLAAIADQAGRAARSAGGKVRQGGHANVLRQGFDNAGEPLTARALFVRDLGRLYERHNGLGSAKPGPNGIFRRFVDDAYRAEFGGGHFKSFEAEVRAFATARRDPSR